MARRRKNLRSISTPIILGAVSVPISLALLVGWTLLIAQNISSGTEVTLDVWLLVLGAISFVFLAIVLVLFSVYLAREILEVRRQDTFIDSVTHELKSPLASLKLCLETMARHDLPEDKREQLQFMMRDDVERLSVFIEDVLQASRLAHSARSAANITDVQLAPLIDEVVDAVERRRHLDGGWVKVEVSPELVISTDETALGVILRNLVDNAVKYSDPPVSVRIAASRDARGRTRIDVTDHGIGIDPRQLQRVFQRFYRVGEGFARERKGTGLGLYVASALARTTGATLRALSEGLGKGTTMRIEYPASASVRVSDPPPLPELEDEDAMENDS